MAEIGDIFNRLAEELANVSAVFGNHGVSQSVPNFKGDAAEFKAWLRALEKFFLISNVIEDRKKNLIAFQACEGPPSDFMNRHLTDNVGVTWAETKQNLQDRFGEPYDAELAFSKLRSIKQRTNETIQIFAERLMSLATEAYEGNMNEANLPLIESQITNIFIEGLNDRNIKMTCLRRNITNLNEAVRIALGEQKLKVRFAGNTSHHEPMECDLITKPRMAERNQHQYRSHQFNQNNRASQFNRTNHHGYQENYSHTSNQRRNWSNNAPMRGFRPNRTNNMTHDRRFRPDIRCYNCGRVGHIARECTPHNALN